MTGSVDIELARTRWTTVAWVAGLTLALPLVVYWLIARMTGLPVLGLLVVAAAGGVLCGLILLALRSSRARIGDGRLHLVAGGLFRHQVSLDALQLDAVQIHYPPRRLGQVIGRRLKGLSLPGAHLGWFTMPYGPAFVVGPAETPVLEIRTGDGAILLAVANPQDALTRLRTVMSGH